VRALGRWVASQGPAGSSVLAAIGGAIAFGIVYADSPFPSTAARLTNSGAYFLWLVFWCAQTAMWFALLPTLAGAVRELSPYWPESRRHVLGVTVTFALLVTVPIVVGGRIHRLTVDVPHYRAKLLLITAIGLSAALLGAAAIALIFSASQIAIRTRGDVAPEEVEHFFRLRTLLQRLLMIEAAIWGAAILTTGTLSHAVNQIHGPGDFPREELIAFGTYLSAVVALLYAPAYIRLRALGSELRDRLVPLEGSGETLTKSLNDRRSLESLLGLDVTAGANFQNGLVILAPLVIGLIASLLGGR
jgi:hypothetical protein